VRAQHLAQSYQNATQGIKIRIMVARKILIGI